jgi:hypothetical protein
MIVFFIVSFMFINKIIKKLKSKYIASYVMLISAAKMRL